MTDRKGDVRQVFSTLGKLFLGTDKEHKETMNKIGKDAAATVKRVRAREGAINAMAETVEEDDDAASPRGDLAQPRR